MSIPSVLSSRLLIKKILSHTGLSTNLWDHFARDFVSIFFLEIRNNKSLGLVIWPGPPMCRIVYPTSPHIVDKVILSSSFFTVTLWNSDILGWGEAKNGIKVRSHLFLRSTTHCLYHLEQVVFTVLWFHWPLLWDGSRSCTQWFQGPCRILHVMIPHRSDFHLQVKSFTKTHRILVIFLKVLGLVSC